jgi:hypothetical protein
MHHAFVEVRVGYHSAVRFYRADLGTKVAEEFATLMCEMKKL